MALTDHVIVLDHLGPQVIEGPPVQAYEDTLRMLGVPEAAIAKLPEADRLQPVGLEGSAKVSSSALHVRPTSFVDKFGRPIQQVTEVDWPCGCGKGLHSHHEGVLQAWAQHVAALEGVDADHLELHAVQKIDGSWRPDGKPRVVCRCGEWFESDSYFPDLAAWEQHVRAL